MSSLKMVPSAEKWVMVTGSLLALKALLSVTVKFSLASWVSSPATEIVRKRTASPSRNMIVPAVAVPTKSSSVAAVGDSSQSTIAPASPVPMRLMAKTKGVLPVLPSFLRASTAAIEKRVASSSRMSIEILDCALSTAAVPL